MIPNKPIDIEEKALEIYSTIYDAIDDLGASECVNEEILSEISFKQAEDWMEGMISDMYDYQRELERERNS